MKSLRFWSLLLGMALALPAGAQSFAFGLKGGPIIGVQQWNSSDRDPLFSYHAIAFIESYNKDANLVSVFLQGGYHIRGSAIRNQQFFNNTNNQVFNAPTIRFIFRNIALSFGGKKRFDLGSNAKGYYLLGLRGEYNLGTNFAAFESFNSLFYPNDFYVRRFTYGAVFGGGFELPLGELVSGVLEFTVNPDIGLQYYQPAIGNVASPWDPSQNINVGERNIRNITFEVSLGLRFLRIVEYID